MLFAVGWTFLPGFVSARQPQGIHAETAVGAMFGLVRTWGGGAARVTVTTAAYIDVPGWAVFVNTVIGLAILVPALIVVVHAENLQAKLIGTGAVVVGIMLSAGLLSLQYVLWLTPFVALSNRRITLGLMIVLAGTSTILAWVWDASIFESPPAYWSLVVRNLLLLITAGLLVWEASASTAPLPVGAPSEDQTR